jgi:hypothetical protein
MWASVACVGGWGVWGGRGGHAGGGGPRCKVHVWARLGWVGGRAGMHMPGIISQAAQRLRSGCGRWAGEPETAPRRPAGRSRRAEAAGGARGAGKGRSPLSVHKPRPLPHGRACAAGVGQAASRPWAGVAEGRGTA